MDSKDSIKAPKLSYKERKKKAQKKRPPGRREWVPTPAILAKIEELSAMHMDQAQIAVLIGLNPNHFVEKKAVYPELDDALQKGRATGLLEVTKALHRNATINENVIAQKFILKSRGGWRENDHLSIPGGSGGADSQTLTEQIRKALGELTDD